MVNNIYLYWEGSDYKLITVLRKLIYLHSTTGNGYKVHLINHANVKQYMPDLPDYFYKLNYANQADYVRVCVVCEYGGIWLDSDTLILDSMDPMIAMLYSNEGFFIRENNKELCNGVFGSRAKTPLMLEWKRRMIEILESKESIQWTEIGNTILGNLDSSYYTNFVLLNGLHNVYPVNWNKCEAELIDKPYDNYKSLVRNFQPFLILVNSVYKRCEDLSEYELYNGTMPLNYFIRKSIENKKIANQQLRFQQAFYE